MPKNEAVLDERESQTRRGRKPREQRDKFTIYRVKEVSPKGEHPEPLITAYTPEQADMLFKSLKKDSAVSDGHVMWIQVS